MPEAVKGENGPGYEASARNVYFFWKGRAALYAVLKALGVGPGDLVVVPGYTCFAVPSAVGLTGAAPLYADIEPGQFNISLEAIEAVATRGIRARVKAIIVQHTYGLPANITGIAAWARLHGIATIEDCAHVWGSRHRDETGAWREVGTEGDASFFSSHWTKPVSTGLGGWVETPEGPLNDRLRCFYRNQCLPPTLRDVVQLAAQVAGREILSSPSLYWIVRDIYRRLYGAGILAGSSTQEELTGMRPKPEDYMKRMSRFQRWLVRKRRSDVSALVHRRKLKVVYEAALRSAGFQVLEISPACDPVLLRYPVRVPDKPAILQEAKRRRIELGDWYRHPVDRPDGVEASIFGYREGTCLEGERAARETVTLPMNRQVTEADAVKMVEFLREVA